MRLILAIITAVILISGCAVTTIECLRNKNMQVEGYKAATAESKNKLAQDLRTRKIALGEGLGRIRMAYGDADDIFVSGCVVRLLYRIDSDKNVTLWFEDGEHLSMWSN